MTRFLLVCALWVAHGVPLAAAAPTEVQLEALKRLQGVDLEANPGLKAVVLKLVEGTRGTPRFVELVRQFKLTGQEAGLLEVALAFPNDEHGVQAMQMLLGDGVRAPIEEALRKPGTSNAGLTVLGNTRMSSANGFLTPWVGDDGVSDSMRRAAVQALAKNEAGARWLVEQARGGRIPEALRLTTATALSQVAWPEVREAGAAVLPLPRAGGDSELPPIADLAARRGDADNGRRVFFRESTACGRCHTVRGEGVPVGPDLSEIGDKLGRDALLVAVLDPNNGIAFGYEAWTVTTRDDQEVYGLIVSETPEELAVKDLSGIVHRLAMDQVASRVPADLSLMPAGLQATMTVEELVDLVEYLAGLHKP